MNPKVGMHATVHFPRMSYPALVMEVRDDVVVLRKVTPVTEDMGYSLVYHNGESHWNHVYTEEEVQKHLMLNTNDTTVATYGNGAWTLIVGAEVTFGEARYSTF